MFRAIFVCFFLLLMCAASGECSSRLDYPGRNPSWDMDVVYAPVKERTSIVGLFSKDIFVEDIRGGDAQGSGERKRPLYDVVCDEMLAFYHFIPEIAGESWQDDDWWIEGVREVLCTKQPFFSRQLQLCCEAVLSAVRGRSRHVTNTGHPYWRDLDWAHVKGRFYPKGKTRQWSVVRKSSVGALSLKDRVFLCFPKKQYALEGVLCDSAEKLAVVSLEGRPCKTFYQRGFVACDWAESSKPNLLALKLQKERQGEQVFACDRIPEKRCCDLSPSPLNILNPHYAGQWNVSVVCFPRAAVSRYGLFDCSRVTVRRDACSDSLLDVLKQEILEGLRVKYSGRFSEKEIQVIKRPEVRGVTCVRMKWRSEFLEEVFLGTLADYWHDSNFCNLTGGLEKRDVCRLQQCCEKHERLLWSIVDKSALIRAMNRQECVSEQTVFVSIQGETAVLKGEGTPSFLSRFFAGL